MSDRKSNERYGVKRPIQKGGQPIHIDISSNLDNAISDIKYWREQEGEQAILVRESQAQESTWWIEIKGY